MIVGIGVDIVENARISEMLRRHGRSFEEKLFTEGELSYADERRRRTEHLAARFAAKEAVAKALGQGMTNGISWRDIEVVHDQRGKPGVKLTGAVRKLADKMGVQHLHISLSHTDSHSVAFVVAEGA